MTRLYLWECEDKLPIYPQMWENQTMETAEAQTVTQPAVEPATQLLPRDPTKTPCSCGRSMVVPQPPFVHCPACHDTYRMKKLSPPARCAHCDFNFLLWRARNNFPHVTVPFA